MTALSKRPEEIILPNVLPERPAMATIGHTTTLSTKGQMILPKAVRERRGWSPGARLLVTDTPDGVLITAADPPPARTYSRLEDVAGMLQHLYKGPPLTIEQMKEGVREAVAEDWRRFERQGGRYDE